MCVHRGGAAWRAGGWPRHRRTRFDGNPPPFPGNGPEQLGGRVLSGPVCPGAATGGRGLVGMIMVGLADRTAQRQERRKARPSALTPPRACSSPHHPKKRVVPDTSPSPPTRPHPAHQQNPSFQQKLQKTSQGRHVCSCPRPPKFRSAWLPPGGRPEPVSPSVLQWSF